MFNLNIPSPITKIQSRFLEKKAITIFLKRDDQIDRFISGNKWRKLKYNFQQAKNSGYSRFLSFGGAYSNHLHALSYAANKLGDTSIGVIRGEEVKPLNTTLNFCKNHNMVFHYLDRYSYRYTKYSKEFIHQLGELYGKFYFIPEGGNNLLGVKGCGEILLEVELSFDFVCASVGTGCTAAGLINSMSKDHCFLGFSPFKDVTEQKNNIIKFLKSNYPNWDVMNDRDFGGFAKHNNNLVNFIRQFYVDFNIKLDIIYMGKLFYYLFDLINKDFFLKNTKILVVHSGGLQGLDGFNFKF